MKKIIVQDCRASEGLKSQRRLMDAHYAAKNHRGLCSEDPLAGVGRVGVPGTKNLSAVDQQEISYG